MKRMTREYRKRWKTERRRKREIAMILPEKRKEFYKRKMQQFLNVLRSNEKGLRNENNKKLFISRRKLVSLLVS